MYFSPVLVGFMLKHKMRMSKRNTALQSYIGVEGLLLCCWNVFADTASQYRVLYSSVWPCLCQSSCSSSFYLCTYQKFTSYISCIRNLTSPQKNQKPPNKTKSHWSDISTRYYALLLKIQIVPWNGWEQEMTASLADYTCPSSSRQPTHWRAYQRSWPTTGHFLPAQNFYTGVEKIKQCQKGTDERKMVLSITKVRRLAFK